MVLWAILILILPAFVLWGTGNLGRGDKKGPTYAGIIDGKKVSFDQFGRSLVGIRCQMILNFFNQPRMLDDILRNKALLGRLAWDKLIMEREARKAGIKVSNDEVVKFITTHPIFARNGRFDDKIYEYVLQRVPIDARSFEEIVRDIVAVRKLNDSIVKNVAVTEEDALEIYKKEKERFRLSYVLFNADSFVEKTSVDNAGIKSYYEANKSAFTIPAKTADNGTVSEGGPAKLEDVKDNIGSFLRLNEARKLALKSAKEEYEKIKELTIKNKMNFETAAKTLKMNLSHTPFFSRNDYLDGIGEAIPLIEIAVKLKPGEISPPVETRKGAVIFEVADVSQSDAGNFDMEKDNYLNKARDLKKTAVLEKWLRQLELANKPVIDFNGYDKRY
jgi:peptidyl-prolyl cis-trans isomerase D